MEGIITAWGRILRGYTPSLSIEITRECPLRCPGCYAYGDDHLGGAVTRQQVQREGYLEEFLRFWSANQHTRQIWVSLFTPQIGEIAEEILLPADRERVIAALMTLRHRYHKLQMPEGLIKKYARPPQS